MNDRRSPFVPQPSHAGRGELHDGFVTSDPYSIAKLKDVINPAAPTNEITLTSRTSGKRYLVWIKGKTAAGKFYGLIRLEDSLSWFKHVILQSIPIEGKQLIQVVPQ
jgi:hypothetical protein